MSRSRGQLASALDNRTANAVIDVDSPFLAEIERRCPENLDTVRDPDLRRRPTPTYRAMRKRLVISPDFYDAIQQPNVRLVTDPIARVEPGGVRTVDGTLHELDVLVLASGFRSDRFTRPTTDVGRDGVELDDVWSEGPVAYLSVTVPGFPNFFTLNGPNGPVGTFSLIEIAERQLDDPLLDGIGRGDDREVSPTVAATERFEDDGRSVDCRRAAQQLLPPRRGHRVRPGQRRPLHQRTADRQRRPLHQAPVHRPVGRAAGARLPLRPSPGRGRRRTSAPAADRDAADRRARDLHRQPSTATGNLPLRS